MFINGAYFISLLGSTCLFAQNDMAFTGLAPTALGDLYFASTLALPGNRPDKAGNVFHYVAGKGFEWFAPGWGPVRGTPDVSADGQVFAVTDTQSVGCVYFRTTANAIQINGLAQINGFRR